MQAGTYIIHPEKKKKNKRFLLAGGSIGRETCSSINKKISQPPLVLYGWFFFSRARQNAASLHSEMEKEKSSQESRQCSLHGHTCWFKQLFFICSELRWQKLCSQEKQQSICTPLGEQNQQAFSPPDIHTFPYVTGAEVCALKAACQIQGLGGSTNASSTLDEIEGKKKKSKPKHPGTHTNM